ncbi:MAG: hypothetical protein E6F96_06930 [Actinobacteria bacterium]|nr:MAG: hypothetical protein E6F96_06930 [Actinomycetota bacterium]
MSRRNKRARGRSRKRRRVTAPVAGAAAAAPAHVPGGPQAASESASAVQRSGAGIERGGAQSRRSGSSSRRARSRRASPPARGGGLDDLLPVGKRPPAPWHPLPLSELLILVGAIGAVVGLSRGISHGGPPLIAGLVAVAIGTVEVTLREHLSGYRSHTIILALIPVLVLDSSLVLLVAPFGTGLKLAMLVLDVVVFALLYKLLRARFLDARRERVFTRGR